MANTNNIILAKDFDVSKISYGDVKLLDNGGKVVYLSYNKAPLVVQTPDMSVPFGMKDWEGNKKFVMDLSFKGLDNRPVLKSFYDMMESLDKKLVEDGFKNQQTWFKGKKYNSTEVVEALYTPLIKHAKDKTTGEVTDKYPATFKVNVPFRDGKFNCEVYDDKRNLVDLNTVETKGSRVAAIIQCMGLWMAGGKFGSSWRVLQMKITPNQNIRGYAFKEVTDDKMVEEDLEDTHDAKEIMEMAVEKTDDEGSRDMSEDDEESEDELEKVETKKPAKKVVMRRRGT
jgi:Family of unknown function (DUF5871)